jgi:hypothetical protein
MINIRIIRITEIVIYSLFKNTIILCYNDSFKIILR